jgi:hypothetical protein
MEPLSRRSPRRLASGSVETDGKAAAQRWPGHPYLRQMAVDASDGRSRQPTLQITLKTLYGNLSIWIKVMLIPVLEGQRL